MKFGGWMAAGVVDGRMLGSIVPPSSGFRIEGVVSDHAHAVASGDGQLCMQVSLASSFPLALSRPPSPSVPFGLFVALHRSHSLILSLARSLSRARSLI